MTRTPLLCLALIGAITLAHAQAPWPFDQPPPETLRATEKKVFAHYFTPFPLSLDNLPSTAPDRYESDYLAPGGSPSPAFPKGRYYTTGGYLRERPLPVPPQPAGTDFELANLKKEIRLAAALGLDGFVLDILGYGPRATSWPRSKKVLQAAAEEDPGFKIVLMPDMDGNTLKAEADPDGSNIASAIAELAAFPSAYRQTGRLVIAPYNAQKRTAEWWKTWIARYEAEHHEKIFFVPLFQNWTAHAPAFLPLADGLSEWGARDPGSTSGNNAPKWMNFAPNVHALKPGLLCMAPVAPQDFRPKEDPLAPLGVRFWEAGGSKNFRTMWRNAIEGGADWVQLITWNDYGECTEIAPSSGIQHTFYDLTAYFTTWFKTGRQPTITRDVIYYFHRRHHSSAPFSEAQAAPFKRAGATPVADEIEMLAFVSGSSRVTLRIEVGGETHVREVDPGIQSFTAPLPRTGRARPSFALIRDGHIAASVTSAFEIDHTIEWQDFLYRGGSSSRPPVRH